MGRIPGLVVYGMGFPCSSSKSTGPRVLLKAVANGEKHFGGLDQLRLPEKVDLFMAGVFPDRSRDPLTKGEQAPVPAHGQ